ncbi:MAG: SAM-dependent methyltransferase [Bacteroidales bacterium]|nr:SAM-dependent methyltransferase [Bacteroidales bacterium]
MNNNFELKPIGKVIASNGNYSIQLKKEFISGLVGIEGFSHLQITWWGSLVDTPELRKILVSEKPYKKGPEKIGVFATRSPVRPNPLLITNISVLRIDYEKGILYTPWIDAENETPVLDIKPYHLSERVKDCRVPQWCDHWPKWDEESEAFDWQNEFNF